VKLLHDLITEGQFAGEIARRDPDQLVLLYLSCLYGLAAGRGFYSTALNEHFPDADAVLQSLSREMSHNKRWLVFMRKNSKIFIIIGDAGYTPIFLDQLIVATAMPQIVRELNGLSN